MKKFSLYPFAIAASLFVLAACSDDDDKNEPITPPEPELPYGPKQDYNYADGAGLAMTYNGEPLVGKVVSVTANNNDYSNPTITLTGAPLNINDLMGQAAPSLAGRATDHTSMSIPTPGVLPGSPKVTLPITLSDDGTFSGEGATEYCNYKYSGTWSEENGIAIQFSDVTLIDQTLGGTSWALQMAENPDYDPEFPDWGSQWIANGIYINWESSVGLDLGFGDPLPIGNILKLALLLTQIEVVPGQPAMPVQDALNLLLTDISFSNDGNIIATYLDEETSEYTVSPKNIAQYVIDNGVLKLFLNPQAIIMSQLAAAEQASRADDGAGLDVEAIMNSLMGLMRNYMPYVSTGFPLGITTTDEGMTLYLGTEFMLPIVSAASAIITQPAILEMIKEAVAKDPTMGSMAPMLEMILTQLPGIVEGTTKLEVGLNLTKK